MAKQSSSETNSESNTPDLSAVQGLLKSLSVVAESLKARGKRHPLIDVLSIAVLGCVCGCDNAEALEDWADKEAHWLSNFLELPHGTPGQDVFLRVFAAINPEQFQSAFLEWATELLGALGVGGQIAIDGQTNRGSRDRQAKRSPIHMVSALACGDGLVLGQVKTDEKSNEITAIPKLLKLLNLQEALVSIDAMGCQVSIAKLIRDRGGDYLLGLKGNQSSLRDEAEALFDATQAADGEEMKKTLVQEATDVNKGHGRMELRTARVISNFDELVPASKRWPDMKSLVAIDSLREDTVSGKQTCETRFYISSRPLGPEDAIKGTRQHWEVENKLHWRLDVSFGQDANQTRSKYAAENLAVVRHFALNIIRNYSGDRLSVPRRRRLCDYKVEYRQKLLGLEKNV